jgi:ribosome maturation factor RimP
MILYMLNTEAVQTFIHQTVQAYDPSCYVVEIQVRTVPYVRLQVLIDTDAGIALEQCVATHRHIHSALAESGLVDITTCDLEVSSPGVGTPLRLLRQYPQNVGRTVITRLNDGRDITGVLSAVGPASIAIRTAGLEPESPTNGPEIDIPFDHIESTTVQVTFNQPYGEEGRRSRSKKRLN